MRRGATAVLCLLAAVPLALSQSAAPANAGPAAPSATDRQKAMQADMTRLLQLARQLKLDVDKTRKDEL